MPIESSFGGATTPSTIQPQSAGTLRVVSSERSMKTYIVTDSEIRNITLANFVAGICFSITSGLWGYALSTTTEVMLGADKNAAAMMWMGLVRPLCVDGGVLFAVVGLSMVLWRHRMINLIKRENSPDQRLAKGRFRRAWDDLWASNQ